MSTFPCGHSQPYSWGPTCEVCDRARVPCQKGDDVYALAEDTERRAALTKLTQRERKLLKLE